MSLISVFIVQSLLYDELLDILFARTDILFLMFPNSVFCAGSKNGLLIVSLYEDAAKIDDSVNVGL